MAKKEKEPDAPEMPEMPNMLRMFLPMGIMYGMKYIDVEKEENIMMMRVGFAASQVFMLCLGVYLYTKVQKSTEEGDVEVPAKPPSPFGGDEKVEMKKMTIKEYDLGECQSKIQQVFMQSLIVGGIHYKWGSAIPLVMSSVMGLMDLPENPMFRLYVLGHKIGDKGLEKRPFKAKNPFSGMTDAMDKAKKDANKSALKEARANAKAAGEDVTDSEDDEEDEKPAKKAIKAAKKDDSKSFDLFCKAPLGFRLSSEGDASDGTARHIIAELTKGGQAEKLGLKLGYHIRSLDGEDLSSVAHTQTMGRFKEKKNSDDETMSIKATPNANWAKIEAFVQSELESEGVSNEDADTYWPRVLKDTADYYAVVGAKMETGASAKDVTKLCKGATEEVAAASANDAKEEQGGLPGMWAKMSPTMRICIVYMIITSFFPQFSLGRMLESYAKSNNGTAPADFAAMNSAAAPPAGADMGEIDEFGDEF
jgi:hypothetical protein